MPVYDQAQQRPSPNRAPTAWGLGMWIVIGLVLATLIIGGRLIFSAVTDDHHGATSETVEVPVSVSDEVPSHAESGTPDPMLASGPSELIAAEKAGAIFMFGLILGMSCGITLFFLYLRRKELHARRFHVDEDPSFDNWPVSTDRASSRPPSSPMELGGGDEMIEQPDPWERSVDWWKEPDDGDQ